MPGQTILVVEDNPITRKMMRFALESEGHHILEAGDGETALKLARERPPALVVQDHVLPDRDGLSLLQALRELPGCSRLPILVVTGMVSQLEGLRARTDDLTTFLPKPVEPSRLIEVVRTHLAGQPSEIGRRRRVLVVDDEPLNRKLAVLRLRDAGFEVEAAGSGEEALAKARLSPPEAVVSDVLMPGMDGFLLCRAVRGDPSLAQIPVLLVSSSYVDDDDRRLARMMGASGLLLRTPDLAGVAEALAASLEAPGPPSGAPQDELPALHKQRLDVQLEKELARNEALLRQGAIQAAALSVVRGLASALARPFELPSVLADVLVHCLDAAGLSTGLLYLVGGEGRLRLQAQAGVPREVQTDAAAAFGLPDVMRRIMAGGLPVACCANTEGGQDFAQLAARLGHDSALIVPFVGDREPLGVLVLASSSQDLSEPAWMVFARALAAQFGETIAVAQSLSRGAASETRYRSLMEHANDAILLLDAEYLVLEANRQTEALLGRPREELVGRRYEDLVSPGERELVRSGRAQLMATGTLRIEDRHLIRSDGGQVSVEASASLVKLGEETVFLFILRDIGERKQAALRLEESKEKYRLLFDANPHPMFVYDPETLSFLAANGAAVRQYGYSEAEFLAMTVRDLRPPEDVVELPAFLESRAQGSAPTESRARHRKKDGTLVDVEVAANPIQFEGRNARLVVATDVTDKAKLEAQLLQSQKMEAVGRLAGGIAHDFNNLLGVITGYAELLLRDLGAHHPGARRAEEIRKAAERAAGLTRQLLAFSRKQVLSPKILDLNAVVADVDRMLRRLIGEDVQLVGVLGPSLGHVLADPGQIEQVLLNLAINARDAMLQGGKLIVETSNTTLDASYSKAHGVPAGDYVMLAVSDTGHGMDAKTLTHIFEPFFTTKAEGKGTGLGLSTVFGIVTQSGGHIGVYSELGVGTTFRIYLPRVSGNEQPDPTPEPEAEAPGGSETILMVEDAEALGLMVGELLESAGYAVLPAPAPREALEIARSHPGTIHLLLTDVVMPGMSGREVAERVRAERPDVRVLYMSGYTDEAIGHHGVLDPGIHFIQKPFTGRGLLRKIREVLDAP